MADNDVTIKGRVLRDTPSGMAVVFRPEDGLTCEEIILPKSQIAVVTGVRQDAVTMPRWLAEERGLW